VYPAFFKGSFFEAPSYMVLLIVGFALAIWLCRREEDASGRNGDRVVDLGIVMAVCGIVGARLLSVLADGYFMDFVHLCTDPTLVPARDLPVGTVCQSNAECGDFYLCNLATNTCYPPRDCLAWAKFWNGGLAYYGGFLLAVPVGLWMARRAKLGLWRIADLTAPFIAFGLFFGRIGCFLNGCCYGRPSTLPWAVDFPQIRGHGTVHPTQLYESLGALAVFALLYFGVRPRKRAHGQVFAWLLVLYGALRFGLEFFRDDDRGALFGLSTSQWIGIPLVAWGVHLALRRHHGPDPLPGPAGRA
jgi:phosphatidylglycerol:prolipoprotein diacylglycerol transferase